MKSCFNLLIILIALLTASAARSTVIIDKSAPDFVARDSHGKEVKLSDFRGQFVVLEWFHPRCPFTRKHYESGNMQSLQSRFKEKGVVWLSVMTSLESHGFHKDSAGMNAWSKQMKAKPSALIMDTTTELGMLYGARTTPHMFVINPQGKLIYAGAIDDKRGLAMNEIKTATNYVSAALNEAMAGKPAATAQTRPYGCPIKYE